MATHMDKNTATSSSDAEKIIPRAEFRVFGHGIIERVKEKMWDAKATLFKARKMPEETYFLSLHTDTVNVKVRDGLLDIKTKTGETPEGYEIFQPRGKFQFPVQREELATILQHLQVNMALDKESYTLEEFTNMARASSDLVPVKVEKMRYGFPLTASSANTRRYGLTVRWSKPPVAKVKIMPELRQRLRRWGSTNCLTRII